MAGCLLSGIPTWSVLSASGIAGFVPPADVRILTVFADNDLPNYGSSSKTTGMVATAQDAAASGSARREARRIRILPIPMPDGPKRGRGRPTGFLGVKKRAAMAANV